MGRRRFHAAFILYKTLGYPELRYNYAKIRVRPNDQLRVKVYAKSQACPNDQLRERGLILDLSGK